MRGLRLDGCSLLVRASTASQESTFRHQAFPLSARETAYRVHRENTLPLGPAHAETVLLEATREEQEPPAVSVVRLASTHQLMARAHAQTVRLEHSRRSTDKRRQRAKDAVVARTLQLVEHQVRPGVFRALRASTPTTKGLAHA